MNRATGEAGGSDPGGDDLLAKVGLLETESPSDPRDGGVAGHWVPRETVVSIGRPLVHRLRPAQEALMRQRIGRPARMIGVTFGFEFLKRPLGASQVTYSVDLDVPEVRAISLDQDPRLIPSVTPDAAPDAPVANNGGWGMQSASFGWSFSMPDGEFSLPYKYLRHAVIEIPAEATILSGEVSIEVTIVPPARSARRPVIALTQGGIPFVQALP
jgi:hypothetical protein